MSQNRAKGDFEVLLSNYESHFFFNTLGQNGAKMSKNGTKWYTKSETIDPKWRLSES